MAVRRRRTSAFTLTVCGLVIGHKNAIWAFWGGAMNCIFPQQVNTLGNSKEKLDNVYGGS